jgi:hypothetical protein
VKKVHFFLFFLVQETFWIGTIEVGTFGEFYILLGNGVHFLNYDGLPIRYRLNGNELKRIQMKRNERK